jgi:four helix bundle protein
MSVTRRTPRDFTRLKVWEKAHELVLVVYRLTKRFPKSEQFALANQMQRAATSIPANISEGCGRGGEQELRRFMTIAQGSASELAYFAILARDLQYITDQDADDLEYRTAEVRRMLTSYSAKLTSEAKG